MTDPVYDGRPWRSRFLRAPKIALELEARADFVTLTQLAKVSLGLKTGADSFFYLTPVGITGRLPALGDGASARALLTVEGHKGWQGQIANRDLLPAIRNPHELFGNDRRLFVIDGSAVVYLYPRDREPSGGLAEYIRHGERDGLHRGDLVTSNASERGWYRQVRAVVRSRWALPYNSAYDYGAWENARGAILNGRFVGVDAVDDVDQDLLGAALNSTWVMASRLLEGVSTGSEGAFDVGPPAARLTVIPDIRRASGRAAQDVRDILSEFRSEDCMPPGPDSDAHVEPLRSQLDLAVMCALGLSRGEASVLQERLYHSYARWRRAVADLEALSRVNRSNARRHGQTRGISPIQKAAHDVWELLAASYSAYPTDFLTDGVELEEISIRGTLPSPTTQPLFDAEIVQTADGPVSLGSWDRVRYAATMNTIGFETPFLIPRSAGVACRIADQFAADRVLFLAQAKELASGLVPASSIDAVVAASESLWYRTCRVAGMGR